MAGPAECPTRPYCEIGMKNTYGIKISSFTKLDAGGPLTIKAIKDGTVDFGLVFSSDPSVAAQGLTVLSDDKNLQQSDNVVPIIATKLNKAPATTALNAVSAKLSQEALVGMNTADVIQHAAPAAIASGFLSATGLDATALCGGTRGSGKVVVGANDFYESQVLANVYAAALKACGYNASVKKGSGKREVVFPQLKKGDIDVLPEYAATLTTFLKGTSSNIIATTMTALRSKLPSSLVALEPSAATDQNAFAVTKAFATAHSLTTLSDLAKYSQG
jgi:osmoprotectant transport system substrate-binding protein